MQESESITVKHYLFVDSHFTWWACGKSYLCRIVDMLHMGYVDEVLFGREVLANCRELQTNGLHSRHRRIFENKRRGQISGNRSRTRGQSHATSFHVLFWRYFLDSHRKLTRGRDAAHGRSSRTGILRPCAGDDYRYRLCPAEVLPLAVIGLIGRAGRIGVNFNAPIGEVDDPVDRDRCRRVNRFLEALIVAERTVRDLDDQGNFAGRGWCSK